MIELILPLCCKPTRISSMLPLLVAILQFGSAQVPLLQRLIHTTKGHSHTRSHTPATVIQSEPHTPLSHPPRGSHTTTKADFNPYCQDTPSMHSLYQHTHTHTHTTHVLNCSEHHPGRNWQQRHAVLCCTTWALRTVTTMLSTRGTHTIACKDNTGQHAVGPEPVRSTSPI